MDEILVLYANGDLLNWEGSFYWMDKQFLVIMLAASYQKMEA